MHSLAITAFSPMQKAVIKVSDDEDGNQKADGVQRRLSKVWEGGPKAWGLVAADWECLAAEDIRGIVLHDQQRRWEVVPRRCAGGLVTSRRVNFNSRVRQFSPLKTRLCLTRTHLSLVLFQSIALFFLVSLV